MLQILCIAIGVLATVQSDNCYIDNKFLPRGGMTMSFSGSLSTKYTFEECKKECADTTGCKALSWLKDKAKSSSKFQFKCFLIEHNEDRLTYGALEKHQDDKISVSVNGSSCFEDYKVCPTDKYQISNGECVTECPAGSYKTDYHKTCVLCPRTTYSTLPGQTSCSNCPSGYTSAEGSTSSDSCLVCDAGKGKYIPMDGLDEGKCIPCSAGSYVNEKKKCKGCPEYKISPEGSSSIDACVCEEGTKIDGDGCSICPKDSYNPSVNEAVCTACGNGLTTLNSKSRSEYDCICDKGKYVSDGECIKCPVNTYRDNTNNSTEGACTSCPDKSTSPKGSRSAQDCICQAGYYSQKQTSEDYICIQCPKNTYNNGTAHRTSCPSCPSGKISVEGSTSRSYCKVEPGFKELKVAVWQTPRSPYNDNCPENTYDLTFSTDKQTCEPCPPGKLSLEGASTIGHCIEPCPVNTYDSTPTERFTTCQVCPKSTPTSQTGSISLSDCKEKDYTLLYVFVSLGGVVLIGLIIAALYKFVFKKNQGVVITSGY